MDVEQPFVGLDGEERPDEVPQQESQRRGARSSVIVMACTLLSRLLGIVKTRAISSVFGATGTADVINFTFNIPNNFRKLFAEGAMNSAYIPVFASLEGADVQDTSGAQRLMAVLNGFQLLMFLPLTIATWIFAPQIVSFLSDFRDPTQLRLSAGLLGWFMLFLATISIGSVFNGMLQCRGSFFAAAAAPLLFSVSVICSVLFASQYIGAYSMALGTVVGGVLQTLCSYLRLRQFGYRLRFSFDFRLPAFRQVMQGWWPVTLSSLVAVVSQQVAFTFASSLSTGSVTAFNNAIIFWQTPYGIFFTAISTVLFPQMSRAFSRGDRKALADTIVRGLQYLATFLVPAAIALLAIRKEAVGAVLQTGKYTQADTLLTAQVLTWYLIGMLPVAWYGFIQRYCYSVGKFKSTLTVSVIVTAIDIALTWTFITCGWQIISLPIANSISFVVGCIILYFVAVRPLQEFSPRMLAISVGKVLLANIPLAIASVAYSLWSPSWWQAGSTLGNLAILMGLLLAAGAITFASYFVAHVDFLSVLTSRKR